MSAIVEFINAAGLAFVAFAVPMLIQSGVLILLLFLIDAVLRRRVRAVFRCWIWMLVLLKLVLPPSLGSPVSVGTWFGDTLEAPTVSLLERPGPQRTEQTSPAPLSAAARMVSQPVPAFIESSVPVGESTSTASPASTTQALGPRAMERDDLEPAAASPAPTIGWQGLTLLTWTAIAASLLLLLVQRALFVRGLVAQAEKANASMQSALDDCRSRLGLRDRVVLKVSPNASSPAVCGLMHPVILIPRSLAPRLDRRDLQAVLLHELAHIKRGDLWINLAQTLLQIVYFYNPLLWLANAMIRRVREQAVDETVLVAMGESARDYPETLVNLAKLAFRRRPALSLRLIGVVESKSALSGRIKHILRRPFPTSAQLGLLGLLVIAIVAALLLPMAKAQKGEHRAHFTPAQISTALASLHIDANDRRTLSVSYWYEGLDLDSCAVVPRQSSWPSGMDLQFVTELEAGRRAKDFVAVNIGTGRIDNTRGRRILTLRSDDLGAAAAELLERFDELENSKAIMNGFYTDDLPGFFAVLSDGLVSSAAHLDRDGESVEAEPKLSLMRMTKARAQDVEVECWQGVRPEATSSVGESAHEAGAEVESPINEQMGPAPASRALPSPPILGHEVRLNFADPTVRDGSFHSAQSVAFIMSFHDIEDLKPGVLFSGVLIGQTNRPFVLAGDRITIQDGRGREIGSETWPVDQREFNRVIALPVTYGQQQYSCPVHVEMMRHEDGTLTGSYWFCAYLSGRLPWGAGGRSFEIVNLDQQMEFRLVGDGTDKRDAVLGIDIDGDGRIDPSEAGGEQLNLYEPFQIGSRTYRVTEVDPYLPRVVFHDVGPAQTAISTPEVTAARSAVPTGRTERPDLDGDGLSDFQERHKYLTDPANRDSDGDGRPDGDWAERREYTYTVRTVLRFMPPLDEDALCDDFQDARVLKKTNQYIEIEAIHYPLATTYESVGENDNWRQDYAHLTEYLAPGPTTNWDERMRRDLLAELSADGIDVDRLTDKEVAEQVPRWLLNKSRSLDKVFTTFYVHCPNGRPEVLPGLEEAFKNEFERDKDNYDWTIEEHFEHEVLGKGMFYNKTHGSCTSTAVYLTTVLRALGIPTRMVLVSPAVDASDREQILMVKKAITHNEVRETMLAGLRRSSRGFTNHTFNEVYVDNRWVRLDYHTLGPPILGARRFGLQTHLYTINDLSDINFAPTWGTRYAKSLRSDSFAHSNPYSAVEISDLFGVHSNISNPPFTVQDLGTGSKPDIFIFYPAQVSVWDEVLEVVTDVTYNKTGRPHRREYYENLFEGVWQKEPGDVLVLVFALDSDERVPEGYEDLLPQPWPQIESRLKQGQTVELAGEARDMKIILLAAPRAAQLTSLVRDSALLGGLGPSEGAKAAGAKEERPGWLVEFANGVEVRLLGVCTHPSAGQPWWRPDGAPLETAPYETTGRQMEQERGRIYYEFAAEVQGSNDLSIRWKVPGSTHSSGTGRALSSDGRRLAHTYAYTANQPPESRTANVFLGIATGDWETRAVHKTLDREGSYTLKNDHAVAFGAAYEKNDDAHVPVTTNIHSTVLNRRLVAIDIEGKLHRGGSYSSGGNVLHSSTYAFDVPLSRITELRFETRPYIWVEFRNVSLRPGQDAGLQVHFAATYNPDADGGALVEPGRAGRRVGDSSAVVAAPPNGVTIEFLAYSQLTPEGLRWWTPEGEATTIPGVYEADVQGHGTILAFRMEPEVETLYIWSYQPPNIRNKLEKKWHPEGSDIWLVALGEHSSFANIEIQAIIAEAPVLAPVTFDARDARDRIEIDQFGIGTIANLEAVGENRLRLDVSTGVGDPQVVAVLDEAGAPHAVRRVSLGPYAREGPPGGRGQTRLEANLPADRLAGILVEAYATRGGRVRFRNISFDPRRSTKTEVEVVAEQQGPWWNQSQRSELFEGLAQTLHGYAKFHGSQYPDTLADTGRGSEKWIEQHVVYLGRGKTLADDPPTVIAYEKTLLSSGYGTYVVHSDNRIEFNTPAELQRLGIIEADGPDISAPATLEPPDETETRESAYSPVSVELPNGVTVEFLAYSQLTPAGLKWWTPQGQRTTIPGVHEADVEGLGTILAFAIDPPDIDLTAVSYRSGNKRTYPDEWRLGETNIWFVALSDEGNYANIELWAVRWEFPVSHTVAISADDVGGAVTVNEYGVSRISNLQSWSRSGMTTMTQLTVHRGSSESTTPVAAVDANGVRYSLGHRQRSSTAPNAYSYRTSLLLDQLRGIVFEARRANSASVKFANVALAPERRTDLQIDVGQLTQSWQGAPSHERLPRLSQALEAYATEHDRAYPDTLEALAGYITAHGDFEWALANLTYLGRGRTAADPPGKPLAYDRQLLARQDSTYVLYGNDLVLLEGPERLKELGIPVAGAPGRFPQQQRSRLDTAASAEGPGPLGRYGVRFDGIDDCLIVPPSASLVLKSPFCIEVWFKPDFSGPRLKDLPFMSLLRKGTKVSVPPRIRHYQRGGFVALVHPPGEPGARCSGIFCTGRESGEVAQDGIFGGRHNPLPLNRPGWVHVFIPYSGQTYMPSPDGEIAIGENIAPFGVPFKGEIAEIRLWNYRLNDEEIRHYGLRSLRGDEPGLVACWTFEEGSGQVIRDISANQNHARLGSSTGVDAADPGWVELRDDASSIDSTASSGSPEGPRAVIEPRLRFVAWHVDEDGAALRYWHPDGTEVTETHKDIVRELHVKPRIDEDGTGERYLTLWFADLEWHVPDHFTVRIFASPARTDVNWPLREWYKKFPGADPDGPPWTGMTFAVTSDDVYPAIADMEVDHFIGPWQTVGEDIPLDVEDLSLGSDVRLSLIDQNAEERAFALLTTDQRDARERYRLVAVTANGASIEPWGPEISGPQDAREETFTFKTPLSEIHHLQLQRRVVGTSRFDNIKLPAWPAAETEEANAAGQTASGQVLDPDGDPAAGAQVALCTAKIGVIVSDGVLEQPRASDVEKGPIVKTDAQGRFRFEGPEPDDYSVVVAHDTGFARIGSNAFADGHQIRLQAWGRIEGRLAEERQALENKIWMSSLPNATWFNHQCRFRYETQCDTSGHFAFERVPAGRYEVGYLAKAGDFSSSITSRTPVEVEAGRTTQMKLGGEGRPVIGRFVPPADYQEQIYFGQGLRALVTARPTEPRPDDYDQMTQREQQQWRKQWRDTSEAKAFYEAIWSNPHWRHYCFHTNSDGTFRIEDVIPGTYDMTVWLEERMTGQGRPEEIGSYYRTVEVPEIPGHYSDEPLDLGELMLKMRHPLHVGDMAPLFEAKTLDGNDVRLIDYRGRYVLLSFWSPVFHPELDRLKELHESYKDTGRLQIIGLGGTDTADEVTAYIDEHRIEWPQIYFGGDWDAGLLQQLGGQMQILLIDPDGKIIATWLRGEELTNSVRDALGKAD